VPSRLGAKRALWLSNSTPATPFLDVYPGSAGAYSVRRLSSSYQGAALRIRRSTPDTTEMDIGFNALGNLDIDALMAFVGGGNGMVSIWYDQSGNGAHYIQTTGSNQPQMVTAGSINLVNNRPSILFDGVNDSLIGNTAGLDVLRNRSAFTFILAHSLNTMTAGNAPAFVFFSTGTNSAASRMTYLAQGSSTGVSARTVNTRTLDASTVVSRNTANTYNGLFNLYSGTLDYNSKVVNQIRNGTIIDTTTFTAITAGNTSDTPSLMTSLGCLNNVQQFGNANFTELIFYPSAVDTDLVITQQAAIARYYGLSF
jgi:Alpha-L-arabinofuranosidase B, catalytic